MMKVLIKIQGGGEEIREWPLTTKIHEIQEAYLTCAIQVEILEVRR